MYYQIRVKRYIYHFDLSILTTIWSEKKIHIQTILICRHWEKNLWININKCDAFGWKKNTYKRDKSNVNMQTKSILKKKNP